MDAIPHGAMSSDDDGADAAGTCRTARRARIASHCEFATHTSPNLRIERTHPVPTSQQSEDTPLHDH